MMDYVIIEQIVYMLTSHFNIAYQMKRWKR